VKKTTVLAGLFLAAGTAVALSPSVLADPPVVEAGSESAAATISDLESAGYDVITQFENGDPDVDLDQCNVTDINTVGSVGSEKQAYVTITCPSNPS
jgi:hypothetical protein